MTAFDGYAQFYDALYGEKDYAAECDFLEGAFARYASGPVRSILDLGCGTGGHALPLARRGYQVTGVDWAEPMLARARAKAASAPDLGSRLAFEGADIRALDLGRTFDAAIAMFCVVSYMATNDDLAAALSAARRHLRPGGLLIFDAWYGPAVLTVRPGDRYRAVALDGDRVLRFIHPEVDLLAQRVDLHLKILRLAGGRVVDEVDEVHPLRFVCAQEIAYFLAQAGFCTRHLCPFPCLDGIPGERDWNLGVVAQAC